MSTKAICLFVLLCCVWYYGAAQHTQGSISGVIKDANNMALDGATVSLLQAPDSTVLQTMVAHNGRFVFKNLPVGEYFIRGSFIGYVHYTSTPLTIDVQHASLALPVIVLQPVRKQALQQVVVNARKKLVEHKIDRTIIHVEAMISAAGGNALDVLGRSPGVMVDINGNISLYGKGGVLVLIDDRPTWLAARDLAAYLRSLPADLIATIELMSSPPARYDASGSAVINIVMKKNRAAGFNGTASAAYYQGVYSKYNSTVNVNYRTRLMNLFGSLGYSADKNFNQDTYNRYYYNPDGSSLATMLMNNRYTYQSNSVNLRAGMDYFVSPKTTLGVLFTANTRPKKDGLNYNSLQYDGSGKLDSAVDGSTTGDYRWKMSGINLNLQHKFDSSGTMLSADLDYVSYRADGAQLAQSQVTAANGPATGNLTILNQTPSNIQIYSAKADYTRPMPGKVRIDAGGKTSFVTTDNETNWFSWQGNTFVPDYTQTNHFIYRENINGLYVNAIKEWRRWGMQMGMRLENTNAEGRQLGNAVVQATAFKRSYTNLFPTFYLLYKLDSAGDNTLRLAYQKRIRRPNYQQLNPFLIYRDKYSYSAGNPDLKAHYNNFVELQFNHKSSFGFLFFYGRINNIIQTLTEVKGDSLITRPQNFGIDYSFNFRPYISVSPVKGWDLNSAVFAFYLVNKGNAYGQYIDNKVFTWELEINNQFRLGHGWSAETNMFWGSLHKGGQSIARGAWSMNAGIQKMLLAGNGVLRLKLDDIFHTRVRRDTTIGLENALVTHRGTVDSRVAGVSFSYRFGKASNARKRNKNAGGAGDEQGRAN